MQWFPSTTTDDNWRPHLRSIKSMTFAHRTRRPKARAQAEDEPPAATVKSVRFFAGLERTARNDVYFAAFKNFEVNRPSARLV